MRIRYIKPGGDGVEADLPDGAARRLIASGAAEAVVGEGPTVGGDDAAAPGGQAASDAGAGTPAPRTHKPAAMTTRRSR